MRKTFGKYVLRTSAFTLACLALAGGNVQAVSSTTTSMTSSAALTGTALQTFSTVGSVGTTGITGNPDITFAATSTGSFLAPSAAGLGSFVTSAMTAGTSTTYDNTPFSISYNPLTTNGVTSSAVPVVISGYLNGTVSADAQGNQSNNVVATFSAINSPVFQTPNGNFVSTVSLGNTSLFLVPSTTQGGMTSVEAIITTTGALPGAAPEPTTLAILATSLVGLGLRQKLRSGRKAS